MDFNEYQKKAMSTATYDNVGNNVFYPTLELAGEAGEIANKIGKLMWGRTMTDELRDLLALELGDALWGISALAYELGLDLSTIAQMNLDKLSSRVKRGVLIGDGDKR